jgi:hypothetical protein
MLMNRIFLSRLRRSEEGRFETAEVAIDERDGVYQVSWRRIGQDGDEPVTVWYAGGSWEDMMAVFRYRLLEQRAAGFRPDIEQMPGMHEQRPSFVPFALKLEFYSELHRNEQLYSELRTWRKSKAAASRLAAYVIAGNGLLSMISAFVPHTKEELGQLPGIGEHRLKTYGDEILGITGKYERKTTFPLDWVKEEVDPAELERWYCRERGSRLKADAELRMLKKRALQAVMEGTDLKGLEGMLNRPKRELVQWLEEWDAAGYDMSAVVERELANVPQEEVAAAEQCFARLGHRYLKPVFEELYAGKEQAAGAGNGADQEERYIRLRLIRLKYRSSLSAQGEGQAAS